MKDTMTTTKADAESALLSRLKNSGMHKTH